VWCLCGYPRAIALKGHHITVVGGGVLLTDAMDTSTTFCSAVTPRCQSFTMMW